MTRLASVALAAAIALAPAGALAGDKSNDIVISGGGSETRNIVVTVTDVDLASTQGLNTVNARIEQAATTLCVWATGTVIPRDTQFRDCHARIVNEASADLQSRMSSRG